MTDVVELLEKSKALESENASLKIMIDQLRSTNHALDSTLVEILKANINLKASAHLLETKANRLTLEVEGLNGTIEDLRSQLEKKEDEKDPNK